MNKKDLLPIILLILLIPLWLLVDRKFIAPKFPAKTPAPVEQPALAKPETGAIESAELTQATPQTLATELPDEEEPQAKEVLAVLENEKVTLELTSFGGGIKTATLREYPELNLDQSMPVLLDFSDSTALAYEGLKGIGAGEPLSIQPSDDGKSVAFSKVWKGGPAFHRTITLGDGYLVTINDRFVNSSPNTWNLPSIRIVTGRMKNPEDMEAQKGISILGVDSFTPAGGIDFWGRSLNKLYGKAKVKPYSIDTVPSDMNGVDVDWVSAKNKFFTQILRPDAIHTTMAVLSSRETEGKGVIPKDVAAALVFNPEAIEPGASHDVSYSYFIGPKKYSILKEAGNHMEKVMEFETVGAFSFMNWLMEPSRRALLWTLNFFDNTVPGGYGVAIILLTLLVRILFWPLTHKSTEKMRENSEKMQVVQPKIKALQDKYKSNPVKLREETMKVYQEHGFNPMGMMGGCLPMLVQLPVFIALFTVLRNAIELRYAGFLWIADLSSPENLLAGSIPFVGSLNVLPLLMSASMMVQQKMTPQMSTTPEQQQQQKMMMYMMPIMMLFFFYTMPSGLVLYWTTSNLLMIAQTAIRNFKKKRAEA